MAEERLTVRRGVLLALAAALAPGARCAASDAGSVHVVLPGHQIAIHHACAARIVIEPRGSLGEQVVVDARASHPEEIARLTVSDPRPGAPTVSGAGTPCWRPAGTSSFTPTLALTVGVPASVAVPVALDSSGAPEIRIGDTRGPLALDLSGAGHVEAGAVGPLRFSGAGTSLVSIGVVHGAARFDLSGDDKVIVARIVADQVTVDMSGSGLLALGPGSIANASLSISGSGTIGIRATVGNARADVSGSGHVDIGRVAGRFDRSVSGSGGVSVGD